MVLAKNWDWLLNLHTHSGKPGGKAFGYCPGKKSIFCTFLLLPFWVFCSCLFQLCFVFVLGCRDSMVDMGRALTNALVLSMVLGCSAVLMDTLLPNSREPVVNVAVVFGGSSYPFHIRNRLTHQSFLDMPLEIHPVTVIVNDTNPSTLLTQICGMLSSTKIHGIVFEDNIGTEAVAQILDFISSQTHVPIISISGGSAVVLTPKVTLLLLF